MKMPAKRSRTSSSSSLLATPVATSDIYSINRQVKVMKATPPPSILTFTSPLSVGVSDQTTVGGFLERCRYCKKLITGDSEIFMYSNLCAFCSIDCRDSQIALDQLAEKQLEKSKGKLVLDKVFHD